MKTVISVVGKSKRGKTTFLTRIIPLLKEKGYTVCVVKHSRHMLTHRNFDHEGKDTFAFSEAGADEVWLTSPRLTFYVTQAETSLDHILETSEADFIITEGFTHASTKKIVIKAPGEEIAVKGDVLATIEGEYDPAEIVDVLIHS